MSYQHEFHFDAPEDIIGDIEEFAIINSTNEENESFQDYESHHSEHSTLSEPVTQSEPLAQSEQQIPSSANWPEEEEKDFIPDGQGLDGQGYYQTLKRNETKSKENDDKEEDFFQSIASVKDLYRVQYGAGTARSSRQSASPPRSSQSSTARPFSPQTSTARPSSPQSPVAHSSSSQSDDSPPSSPVPSTSTAPPPPLRRKTAKRKLFPSSQELAYLERYADIVLPPKSMFRRLNLETIKLPPTQITLKNLDQLPPNTTLDDHTGKVFDIFLRKILRDSGGNLKSTKFWLNLRHPGYNKPDGFWIMHQTYPMADGHFIINSFAGHSQSRKELKIDETLVLSMKIFEKDRSAMPGRGKPPKASLGAQVLDKFNVTGAVVGDSHCLPKALAIGKLYSDMKNEKDKDAKKSLYNEYRIVTRKERKEENRAKKQLEMAKKLLIDAQMDPSKGTHSLEDFDKLADHLKEYNIQLWVRDGVTRVPIEYKNKNPDGRGYIGIYYEDEHYDFAKPTIADWGARYCKNCHAIVDKEHDRKCRAKCARCGMLGCNSERDQDSFHCEDCNIHFLTQKCYDSHLQKRAGNALPYCKLFVKCKDCFKIYKKSSNPEIKHECYATEYCPVCLKFRRKNHECIHGKPLETTRNRMMAKQEEWSMVIYDFESIVVENDKDGEFIIEGVAHNVNLVAYKIVCNKCYGEECKQCGPLDYFSYKTINGENGSVVDEFVHFLSTDPRLKNAYIIAHNGGNYDHIFLLTAMAKKFDSSPGFIATGSKVINATINIGKKNTLVFRDSARFMPMKLSDMPSAFGLPTQDKGQFPYELNHPENYGKKWPTLPPMEKYRPEYKAEKERKSFEEWYEQNKDTEFDFDEQILAYCKNDVKILTEAVCEYMKTCQSMFNGWNPFIQASTIASYIMFVLKYDHIPEGTVGYIPENGFPVRNNSEFALKYIRWLENSDPNLKLKHTLREGEQKIEVDGKNYFVDAYDEKNKEIYEVNGCLYHGCKYCFPARDAPCPKRKDYTMDALYQQTKARKLALEQAGYKVNVAWECDIKSELRSNTEMSNFFKSCRHATQLRPRQAMYGGRTQAFQSFAAANAAQTLEYYDYCSVYPWVNIKGTSYPIGQPIRITEDFEPLNLAKIFYRGLVFCDILPPKHLRIPVLPYRDSGKLHFPLCRSCAESKNQGKCDHKLVSERYLTGVWCTDELQLALDKGYKILRYHEVWHWPESKWFTGGFFASFMKPLLKQKHEASGWPRPNMTHDEKLKHIEDIKNNDGVEIEMEKVQKNAALRSLAKLFLNSTWGKFAQKPGKLETKLVKTKDHVAIGEFLDEPGYEPKRFEEWDSEHVLISRKPMESMMETSPFTNVVYGALTTSAARIHLYKALDLIGPVRLVYCDTDSVIFTQEKGIDLLGDLKGESLGMMTNEIPSEFEFTEALTVASKVYAMEWKNKETGEKVHYVKAKGMTLNSATAAKVNYESMKKMMLGYVQNRQAEPLIGDRLIFKRGPNILDDITTERQQKRLRPVTDKGRFTTEGHFEPYGLMEKEENLYEKTMNFESFIALKEINMFFFTNLKHYQHQSKNQIRVHIPPIEPCVGVSL